MDYFRSRLDLRSRTELLAGVDYLSEPQVSAASRLRDKKKDGTVIDVAVPATPLVTPQAVILAAEDGTLRSLSRDLKTQYWRRQFQSRFYSSPIFIPGTDSFVIASYSGEIHAVSLSGEVHWSRDLGNRVYGSPAVLVESNRIFVVSAGHRLMGLNLQSGATDWDAALPAPWYSVEALVGRKNPYSSISLAEDGNAILASASCVVSFNSDGVEKWRLDTGAAVRATPALDAESASGFLGNVAGRLLQFSLHDGAIMGEHRLQSKILTSPALSAGRAGFAGENGEIGVWNLRESRLEWVLQAEADAGHNALVGLPDGSGFVFVNRRGNLAAFSFAGQFLWETSQVIDLPFQDPRLQTTPQVTGDGYMYAGSYSGFVYRYSFPRTLCSSN